MFEEPVFKNREFIQNPSFSSHPAVWSSNESEFRHPYCVSWGGAWKRLHMRSSCDHLPDLASFPGHVLGTRLLPGCAQLHKSLILKCSSALGDLLLRQEAVNLRSLTMKPTDDYFDDKPQRTGCREVIMEYLLKLMAYHPNFNVQELILPICTGTDDDFEVLLSNPSLRKLECKCSTLAPLAAGLTKQAEIGTLCELNIFCHREFGSSLDVSVHGFFDALFSLPQLHKLSVSLTLIHILWVECMYKIWKGNSCPKLLNFTVYTSSVRELRVTDTQNTMLDEMCVKYLLKR